MATGIALAEIDQALVVTMQGDLDDETCHELIKTVSERLVHSRLRAAFIDFSAISLLDLHEFELIRGLLKMSALLGAKSWLIGLNPGIVTFLVQMDVDTRGLQFCLHMSNAFEELTQSALEEDRDTDDQYQ